MLDIKELQYLVVCADVASFSKAAKILYTTQPNVSKVIKNLESKLGFPVFKRDTKGIVLTNKGKQAYEHASKILEQERHLAKIYQMDEREEFSVSIYPSSWVADCFTRYYKENGNPNIRYQVFEGSIDTIIQRVGSGLDEIGFLFFMEQQRGKIDYKLERHHLYFDKIKESQVYVYYGNNEPPKADENVTLYLKNKKLVQSYEDEFALDHYWETFRNHKQEHFQKQVAVITNSDYVMSMLLKNTDLCNISSSHLDEHAFFEGVPLKKDGEKVSFGVVYRENEVLSEEAKQFIHYVKKSLEI